MRHLIDRCHVDEDEPLIVQGLICEARARGRPVVCDLGDQTEEVRVVGVVRDRSRSGWKRYRRHEHQGQIDQPHRKDHRRCPQSENTHAVARRRRVHLPAAPDHWCAGPEDHDRIEHEQASKSSRRRRAVREDLERLAQRPADSNREQEAVTAGAHCPEQGGTRESDEADLVRQETRDVAGAHTRDKPRHDHHRDDERRWSEPPSKHRRSIPQSAGAVGRCHDPQDVARIPTAAQVGTAAIMAA